MTAPDALPVVEIARWRWRTTAPVAFDVVRPGKGRYERIVVPEGYEFAIGARGVRLPPVARGLARAALIHDRLYDDVLEADDPTLRRDLAATADTLMLTELHRHATPWIVRAVVWIAIRGYGALT